MLSLDTREKKSAPSFPLPHLTVGSSEVTCPSASISPGYTNTKSLDDPHRTFLPALMGQEKCEQNRCVSGEEVGRGEQELCVPCAQCHGPPLLTGHGIGCRGGQPTFTGVPSPKWNCAQGQPIQKSSSAGSRGMANVGDNLPSPSSSLLAFLREGCRSAFQLLPQEVLLPRKDSVIAACRVRGT